jgi:hypothetical protein
MPRDGSGIYVKPFPDVVEGTTIESTVHNGEISDIEYDLNTPRPIVAGGTGANNAHDAMIALSGEIATQGPVTNYDTYPFVPGSFWSNGGATSEPAAGVPMSGVCYAHGSAPAAWLTIEARENGGGSNPGRKWVREKRTTWSAWALQAGGVADLDAAYVNATGDTMTGPLLVPVKGNQMGVHGGAGGTTAVPITDANIVLYNSGANNWAGIGVDSAGSVWLRVGNSGTPSPAMFINAQNLGTSFNGPVTAGYTTTTGTYYFGNSGTKSLSYDSIRFVFTGGPIQSLSDSNQLGNADGQSWTAALTTADANLVFYGGGNNWAGIGTDTGGSMYFRTGLSGTPPAAFVIQNDQAIYATASIGVQRLSNGYLTKHRFDAGNTSCFETNATQVNMMQRTGGSGYYWVKNDSGFEGGANQATLMALSQTGVLSLYGYAGSAPPPGYVLAIGYGGSLGYGMAMRPVADGPHGAITFMNAGGSGIGSINCTSTATSFNTSSSAELKEDLKTFDAGNIIDETNVYDFKWRSTGERSYGVIAQQAVDVYPTAVTHTINPENKDDEFWGVDYSKYVPVLLQELKALRARVRDLEGRLDTKPQPA